MFGDGKFANFLQGAGNVAQGAIKDKVMKGTLVGVLIGFVLAKVL